MKNLKNLLILSLSLMIIFSLTACANNNKIPDKAYTSTEEYQYPLVPVVKEWSEFNSLNQVIETSITFENLKNGKLSDEEVKLSNKYYEEVVEEKTGVTVRATEGIIYYDENEAEEEFNQRNEDMEKIIDKMQGVKLKVTEGTLHYEEDIGDKNKFNLAANDVGIQAVSLPIKVNRNYPYESDWSGTINYSYSKN